MGTLPPKRGRSIFAAAAPLLGERDLDHSGNGTIFTPPFPVIVE
ncbi:MAG TPA: hypothetical protein PLU22_17760 [Polyangiaceae bacterium]|nr:hypothetical protein [Polyangiaceae bacterium]